eukprot:TRINITY_DN1879_c0_g1_i10.p1 TRINITY_DN1879_c0_g1~~TRINITY_DN1879_c0_g1_i10.p1  ORF type:complete len:101 (+),score=24.23 TRINITY_DN1879_c0_g1_i10:157-459(+)
MCIRDRSKANPTADDVTAVLKSVNIPVDKETLDFVMESVKGHSADSLIAQGHKTLANTVSVANVAGAAEAAAPAKGAAPAKKAAKVEEPSDDDDGMGALF